MTAPENPNPGQQNPDGTPGMGGTQGEYPSQPYPGQPSPQYPGQPGAGQSPQPYPGQPGQPGQHPDQPSPGGYPGQPGQPYSVGQSPQAYPGQPYSGDPGAPGPSPTPPPAGQYPGQPYPGQTYTGVTAPKKSGLPRLITIGVVALLAIAGVVFGLLSFNVNSAKVGDCLAKEDDNKVKAVECNSGEADYEVVAVIKDVNEPIISLQNPCRKQADATSSYWSGKRGGKGTLLCLKSVR